MPSEKQIEQMCRAMAVREGCQLYKWSSPSQRGVPDRILIYPGGVIFVEFKAPGKKPTKLQAHIHAELRALGQRVEVIDDTGAFHLLLAEVVGVGSDIRPEWWNR